MREKAKRPHRRGHRAKRIAGILLCLLVLLATAIEIAIRQVELPSSLREPLVATPVLLDREDQVIAETGHRDAFRCSPVALKDVNPWLISATLAAEDHRFYQHHGIDFRALAGAIARNLRARRVISGASTITQQLVKQHAYPSRRCWQTKLRENLMALRLEREWPKAAILERYLNCIEYGNRLRGIQAASRAYFRKDAKDLTLPEAVYLSGLPQAPSRYNPRRHPDAARARFHAVSDKLQRLAWLDDPAIASLQTPPPLAPPKVGQRLAKHFTAAILSREKDAGGMLRTTLDLDLQRSVEDILERHLRRLATSGVRHAAAVVLDHRDGSVRAWCGSGDWFARDGQIDGVTLPRSCGSTLKPFLYLRAMDRRLLTAATLLPDTPDAIRAAYVDYDPRNYDERFWGPVRVREALANSLNVPAVVTLARTGARDVVDYLQRSGIPLARSLDDYGAGLILGNAEIRMIDLAAAYGALANRGISARPRMMESDPILHLAIASPEAAAIVADILSDNDARRKTFGPFSPLAFEGRRVPCKTGTSSGFMDAWTFGVTGRHVVGVWMGNFSGAPMDEVASVTGPAPAWREIVERLIEEDGAIAPPASSLDLERAEICPLTGRIPSRLGPKPIDELFIRGTAPVENADRFFFAEKGETKICLPPEYAIWCRSSHNYLDATVETTGQLAIVSPRPNGRYLIDSGIPAHRQKIQLIATGANRQELQWEINGKEVKPAPESDSIFWQLEAGMHRLRVRQGSRHCDIAFQVE